MTQLETIIVLVIAAVILSALARRLGAPYPVFLAVGGALLAFLPGAPSFIIPPDLALALFLAPILLDAAYDSSLRDLKDNWVPVTSLVVFAVGLTTVAVAIVTRILLPGIPWAAAITLGALVAPPDAAAATAVLRPLRVPHRSHCFGSHATIAPQSFFGQRKPFKAPSNTLVLISFGSTQNSLAAP